MDIGPGPPANDLEARIVNALGSLGLQGKRVEHSFRDAFIWAQFHGGMELYVSAHRPGTDNSEFAVLGERQIAGITVQRVDDGSQLIRDRFACGDATYAVDGAVPPGVADMEEFLAHLIEALDCA